jgi:hypothetical protein
MLLLYSYYIKRYPITKVSLNIIIDILREGVGGHKGQVFFLLKNKGDPPGNSQQVVLLEDCQT